MYLNNSRNECFGSGTVWIDVCVLVTCDGRQGSGVCIGQRDVFFIRICQVCVTAELLFLGQLEGDRDHINLNNNSTSLTMLSV